MSIKEIVLQKWRNKEIKSESDILDLGDEIDCSYSVIAKIIANEVFKNTSCFGCRHIENRMYYSVGKECENCSRFERKIKDFYEKDEENI